MPADAGARVFAALADPTRRTVLRSLGRRDSATATELAAELPMTRQAVAKHLAALDDAGLVRAARVGRETRYRLTPAPLAEVTDFVASVRSDWQARLRALERHAATLHPRDR